MRVGGPCEREGMHCDSHTTENKNSRLLARIYMPVAALSRRLVHAGARLALI